MHDNIPCSNSLEKGEVIQRVISEIEAIDYKGVENDTSGYSNDTDIAQLIPEIIQLSTEVDADIRAVVVVGGGGSLLNIPRLLNDADLIISLDINPKQLTKNKEKRNEILSASSIKDLLPIPNEDIDETNITEVLKERRRLIPPQIEMESYGNYHYLSSEQELQKTKEFLNKNNIAFVCGDISDKNFTKKLGDILYENGIGIVFLNLSNVSEWVCGSKLDPDKRDLLIESLTELSINDTCPIMHSRTTGKTGRSPIISRLSTGLTLYGESMMIKNIPLSSSRQQNNQI